MTRLFYRSDTGRNGVYDILKNLLKIASDAYVNIVCERLVCKVQQDLIIYRNNIDAEAYEDNCCLRYVNVYRVVLIDDNIQWKSKITLVVCNIVKIRTVIPLKKVFRSGEACTNVGSVK